jgi:hypothetical protein
LDALLRAVVWSTWLKKSDWSMTLAAVPLLMSIPRAL